MRSADCLNPQRVDSRGLLDLPGFLSSSGALRVGTTRAPNPRKIQTLNPLKEIAITQRGWTLDVLTLVRRVVDRRRRGDESQTEKSGTSPSLLTSSPATEFTNSDIYAHARDLEKLHPGNRHIHDKIRQQLQVLRDAGLLLYVARGLWRLPENPK